MTEASAVSDLLARGCRTRSLNATLVDSEMRRMASAEAALAVDAVDDPATMRKLMLRSWLAVEFAEEGPLGISFVAATEEAPLTVDSLAPTGLATKLATGVVAGMTLEAIQPNGMPQPLPVVGRLGFSEIIRRLSQSNTRPLRMWFSLPNHQPNPRGDPLPVAWPVGKPFKLIRERFAGGIGGAMVPQWSVTPLVSQQWAVLRETLVYSWPGEKAHPPGAAAILEPVPEPEPEPETQPELEEGVPGLPSCVIGTLSPGQLVTVSEISLLSAPEGELGQSREIVMAHHLSEVDGASLHGWSIVEGSIQAGGSKNMSPLKQGLVLGEPAAFSSEANATLENAWLNHDQHAQYNAEAHTRLNQLKPHVDAEVLSVQTAAGDEYACDVHQMTGTDRETGLTGVLLRQLVPPTEEASLLTKDEAAVDALAWEVRVPETGCFPSDEVQLLRVKCAGISSAGIPSPVNGEPIPDARHGNAFLDFRCTMPCGGQGGIDEPLVERRCIAGTAASFGQKECWMSPALLNLVVGEPFLGDGPLKQLPATARAGGTAVLLKRGGVPFVEKARRAAGIGAAAVIIVNTEQQHFVMQGHQYNDSLHTDRQTDSGEGLESLPVICVPLEDGQALEQLLRDGGQASLQELRYTRDPEERAVLVPPGTRPWQKLRFHHQVWSVQRT